MSILPEASTKDELRREAANWLRLQELYHLLEGKPPQDWAALLEEATPDPELRERVLSLLATSVQPAGAPVSHGDVMTAGTPVGPYVLGRQLGVGGLGSVYLIERLIGGALQRCALKLLSMRPADTSFRTRFAREQLILATLQHPNITHLLDAGISDNGQPYLVMEFVDGVGLTQYCNEHRLTLRQRVEIFLAICDAVTYAHSKLVVHLDLKPSNVMVSADGHVKLLDFGTSKLIESDGSMTTTILATPAYASPEQLRGEPVTTGCDIYSLGAILYELLNGQRPFATTSTAMAMQRAVTEQEPARLTAAVTTEAAEMRGVAPERLKRLLRGDLAAIVARCLRSRPQDRYSSVETLAADLRSYLAARPVLARRQTTRYRVSKFIRRNRVALAVSVVIFLLLFGEGAYAYRREQQALEQGRRAEQMQQFFRHLFGLANTHYAGKTATTVPELLTLGLQVMPRLIPNPADQRLGQVSIAESMMDGSDFKQALTVFESVASSARIAGDSVTEAEAEAGGGYCALLLGQTKLAADMTDRALTLENAPGVTPQTRVFILAKYVQVHDALGLDHQRAIALLRRAVVESRKPGVETQPRYFISMVLANEERNNGELVEASNDLKQAEKIAAGDPYGQCDEPEIMASEGMIKLLSHEDADAVSILDRAYRTAITCYGVDVRETLVIEEFYARALGRTHRQQEAITLLNASLPSWRNAVGTGQDYAAPLLDLSRAHLSNRDFTEGADFARQALASMAGSLSGNPSRLASAHLLLAQNLQGAKDIRVALSEALLAEKGYSQTPHLSISEKESAMETHALLQQLQAQDVALSGEPK